MDNSFQSVYDILDNFKLDIDSDLDTLLIVSVAISFFLGATYWFERGFPKGRQLVMILSPCIAYLAIAIASYIFFLFSLLWAISSFKC